MSKLKILAGVVIAGMWIFKDEILFIMFLTGMFGIIGGTVWLAVS